MHYKISALIGYWNVAVYYTIAWLVALLAQTQKYKHKEYSMYYEWIMKKLKPVNP